MIRTTQIKPAHIMAHDPSITAWGWVIIASDGTIVAGGCIKTGSESKQRKIYKGDDRVRRIQEINLTLISLIKEYNVTHMVSEQPHGSQSAVAAVMLGAVTGMLQAISDCLNIGLEWYSEGDSKKRLLGKRSADKIETINAIKERYPDNPLTGIKYKDEAIADAISIYHLAKHESPVIRFFRKQP